MFLFIDLFYHKKRNLELLHLADPRKPSSP